MTPPKLLPHRIRTRIAGLAGALLRALRNEP